jgi:hypothetical protein
MIKEKAYLGPRLDKLLELEKLDREGATLKNVSDNMRALTACIGIFIAISLVFKTSLIQAKIIATIWGVWTAAYALLACLQSGLLFATLVQDLFLMRLLEARSERLKDCIAYIFALISVLFVIGGIVMIEASISHMINK